MWTIILFIFVFILMHAVVLENKFVC